MGRSIAVIAALLLTVLWMIPAGATTIVRVADAELVSQAPLVVVARLLDRSTSDTGRLATSYRWSVERVLHGEAGRELTVEVPGGMGADGLGLRIHGVPSFRPGERAILFLEPRAGGHRLLHLMQGAFREVHTGGGSLALRDLAGVVEMMPTARGIASAPAAAAEPLRDFDAFADWIAASARGAAPEPTYRVRPTAEDRRGIAAPFRLFTDPSDGLSMRWFEFDSGGSVPWYFGLGGQPGVAGGGQTEFLTALEAWEADPQTPIRLDFAGISSATGASGLNVILFGDPDDELTDLSPSCSGTLALGGVTYFVLTQPFGSQSYHPILQGHVVTNDGLECYFAASPDASKAAEELFAHELGHTLGIDHSEFSSALMWPFIHNDGRGAQLHDDDLAAARSLYGEPPPPPPPPEPCVPSPTVACLLDGRIQAELTWINDPPNPRTPPTWPSGGLGRVGLEVGGGGSGSVDLALFYLHDPSLPQVMLAIIDGTPVNGALWVFATALTDAGFELLLTDTATGATKIYSQAQGVVASPFIDTDAFPAAVGASAVEGAARPAATAAAAAPCGPTTLCLHGGRFELSVTWATVFGSSGDAGAISYSESSGLFWFFDADSPTLLVNVVDGTSWGDGFWVHTGALTDVEWEMRILDTSTGATWAYTNPFFSLPLLHQSAFPPPLEIETSTAGDEADEAPGPFLLAGDPVTWSYRLTNVSESTVSQIRVVDDQGVTVSCPLSTLAAGAAVTCTASGIVSAGPFRNEATASGSSGGVIQGSVADASHHFGVVLALALEALIDGADAQTPPGPAVPAGSALHWTFTVANGSNVPLAVELSDDGGLLPDCPLSELAPGEGMQCTASSTAAAGAVRHLTTAHGTAPGGHTVTAADETSYQGQGVVEIPALGSLGAGLMALLLLGGGWLVLRRGG